MDIARLPLVFRTARHLKASQCAARLIRQLKRRMPQQHRFGLVAAVDLQFVRGGKLPSRRAATLAADQVVPQLEARELQLLNQRLPFDIACPDWRLGRCDKHRLWTVTLHYHEWLYRLAEAAVGGNSRADEMLRMSLADWIARCDISCDGADVLAWNAYAISTRLEWWIRTISLLGENYWQDHEELWKAVVESLWRQACYLSRNLEWDLRANHLLRDAVGLAWAGRFFSGSLAEKWLQTATRLAVAQAKEQVLADGGHFERSPMYHLEVMEDFEVLAELLSDADARQTMQDVHRRMSTFAKWISHPDGHVAQLNDSSRRRVDSAGLLPTGGRHFAETGLVVWRGDPWCVFFDVGEVGPDYQPGHAHADSLTVECSYAGRRLFVDPGCYSYDNDDRRRYDRATDSHNTVCIDGTDSSEVWHIFRVGRRARPQATSVQFTQQSMQASASHDGYQQVSGRPLHTRSVAVDEDATLRITDDLEGRGRHLLSGGYLLEPGWGVESIDNGWRVRNGDSELDIHIRGSQPLRLSAESRLVHPQFGVEVESTRLCWRYEGELPLRVETEIAKVSVKLDSRKCEEYCALRH